MNKKVRIFGWKGDREYVRDFKSLEAGLAWAKEAGVVVSGHLNTTGMAKLSAGRKVEAEHWAKFAAASFEYVRGIRS